jgi:hypothetical protein
LLHSNTNLPIRYNDYIAALDGLLTGLELTGGVAVLESLFPVLNEANHQHADAIAASLARYISRVSDDNAKEAFDVCFKYDTRLNSAMYVF